MPQIQTQSAETTRYDANGKPLPTITVPGCKATQTTPRYDLLKDAKEPLAIDIEFQECKRHGAEKWHHRIGRIAFVNTKGQTVYDTYVRYEDDNDLDVKMGPKRFGVTWKDIKLENGAKPIHEVQWELRKIMYGRTIIGHGMRLDIASIDKKLWEEVGETIDTQNMYGQVALARLASTYLPDVAFNWHDPTDDARVTMLLYLRRCPYQNRTCFNDAEFVIQEEDFPALGSAAPKKKRL